MEAEATLVDCPTRLWRVGRTPEPLNFSEISPATHTYLTQQLAPLLEGIEISNLDVPTVRGSNRFFTRALAQWAYAATDDDGKYRYSGLRYGSRLGNYECWAIFAGASIIEVKTQAIALRNAALLRVAHAFGLSIH